jgi:hypothetical protein
MTAGDVSHSTAPLGGALADEFHPDRQVLLPTRSGTAIPACAPRVPLALLLAFLKDNEKWVAATRLKVDYERLRGEFKFNYTLASTVLWCWSIREIFKNCKLFTWTTAGSAALLLPTGCGQVYKLAWDLGRKLLVG